MSLLYILMHKEICLLGIYSWQYLWIFRKTGLQNQRFHINKQINHSIIMCKKKLLADGCLSGQHLKPSIFWMSKALFFAIHHTVVSFHSQHGFHMLLGVLLVLILEEGLAAILEIILQHSLHSIQFSLFNGIFGCSFFCLHLCSSIGFSRLYELLKDFLFWLLQTKLALAIVVPRTFIVYGNLSQNGFVISSKVDSRWQMSKHQAC